MNPDPLITGDLVFASRVAESSKISYLRCSQMLHGLGDLTNSPMDLLRIALAIIYYLPCFDEGDLTADPLYKGEENFPVHVKCIDATVFEQKDDTKVAMQVLALNSILAGRKFMLMSDYRTVSALLRKVYSGRSSYPPLISILNCYFCVPAPTLLAGIHKFDVVEITCNTEEKERNRKLCIARDRGCEVSKDCYGCCTGLDRCASAIRKKTKAEERLSF